ncbi:L,D-transpeptidase family protein [Sphingobium phenoxybenzoativorans]|uniref:L,D-transpeptidase family protein n=1 Tax=Sphingobium phenoxybenzoativorans TaxID=1592790 RepID=A0A975K8V0_9SPHN|nr:L,D-transpeptidase family protein [Sphingobium phenoxybenzoativorans]QUT06183.1 L,D-transpeptidase family protein [Sphingobium phenoxybenzoativorans]
MLPIPALRALPALAFALIAASAALLSLRPGQAVAQEGLQGAGQDMFDGGFAQADLAPGRHIWNDDPAAQGPLSIAVSLPQQMLYVFRGDRLIGMAAVSTGSPGRETPVGDYQILQKAQWHRSNLYSNAPMPFMQRLTWDGIAIHAGANPGYPASHGCIRVPTAFARKLFAATALGVRVVISDIAPRMPAGPAEPAEPVYLTIDLDALDAGAPEMVGGRQAHWAAWDRIEAMRSQTVRLAYAPQVLGD